MYGSVRLLVNTVPHFSAILVIMKKDLSKTDVKPEPAHAEIEGIFDGGDYGVDIFKGIVNALIRNCPNKFRFSNILFC